MKAHALIGMATFDPETLRTVYKAFDAAWERIAPGVSDNPEAVLAARMKLAETVLAVAKGLEEFDANGLAELALERMYAEPIKLGS
jgi:hypothetical protein